MKNEKATWVRHAAPFCVMLLSTAAFAQTSAPQPPLKTTPTQMVDTLNGVFGQHKERAIHAKGTLLEGTFTPSPSASRISTAPHFQTTPVPVVVRFSNFAGIPDIPDTHPLASPRGLAIRFKLPDGTATDMVTHSFNGFPSSNADEFHDLLTALKASGPEAAKPTALDAYLGTHPIAKTFLTSPKPAPVSYGSLPYFGVNTLKFTNAKGQASYGRYRVVPVSAPAYLTDAQTKSAAPGYLADEVAHHVAREPLKFKLLLQVAQKGDKIDDPSVAWPETRQLVELGTLVINKMAENPTAAQKAIVFMPNALPKGIEVEDQMMNFRSASYAVSFGRRQ
jgi:catalase